MNEFKDTNYSEELDDYSTIDMVEEFECPFCTSKFTLDLSSEDYETETEERNMGTEIVYHFDFECSCPVCENLIGIRGFISEYPQGAYNTSEFEPEEKLSDINLISSNDIEQILDELFSKDRISYSGYFDELITDFVDDVKELLDKSCNPINVGEDNYYEEEQFMDIVEEFVGSKQAEYLNS